MTPQVKQHNQAQLRAAPPANMAVAEAAIYMGISERKLRELIAIRDIRSVRIGRRVILRRIDIDAFIETRAR